MKSNLLACSIELSLFSRGHLIRAIPTYKSKLLYWAVGGNWIYAIMDDSGIMKQSKTKVKHLAKYYSTEKISSTPNVAALSC